MHAIHLQIVDCDTALCASLSEYLRAAGLRVNVAHSSQDALQHMRQALPDVLLVDPSVPGSQALVAACRSDPRLHRVPLVVLSADASLTRVSADLGARAGLAKPIDLDVLLAVLKVAARR